jgi:hypothetical protein
LRLAIIGTPRSGNSWLRYILRDAYGLTEMSFHHPREIPTELPPAVVLQIHWYRVAPFRSWLKAHGFRVIVPARHPLDVLLSILHFVRYEPETARWLDGAGAIPADLRAASPVSPAFAAYACGQGAANLLGVSAAWWRDDTALRIRYEDMVRDPYAALAPLIAALGAPRHGLAAALAGASLDVFKGLPNRHGWQGTPGLWRSLIPPGLAMRIYLSQRAAFQTLGYGIRPYWLPSRIAGRNWAKLTAG